MSADRKANRDVSPATESEGRVVPFRPRATARNRPLRKTAEPEPAHRPWPEPWEDYYGDENEEHPRRTLLNVIGVACTVLLIGLGLWLAHTLIGLRAIQDCVLSGRTNCAPIEVHSSIP
jgi:hypothetical protein